MTHTVRIPWRTGDTISKWDEVCVWALEEFGLPGERYSTHPKHDAMFFVFQDSRDAIYFKLRWL